MNANSGGISSNLVKGNFLPRWSDFNVSLNFFALNPDLRKIENSFSNPFSQTSAFSKKYSLRRMCSSDRKKLPGY